MKNITTQTQRHRDKTLVRAERAPEDHFPAPYPLDRTIACSSVSLCLCDEFFGWLTVPQRAVAFLVMLGLLLSLSTAASAFSDTLPKNANIKSVAIISAIGETFMFEHVRATPFEWISPPETSFLEISDWGIDDFVTRTAATALSQRYKVVPVKYQESDFDTWTWYNLQRHLRELPPPDEDVDTYVVILREWRGDDIGHSVHQIAGLGLYRWDNSDRKPKIGTFASYRIAVVDAHTYKVLASRRATLQDGKLPWLPLPASRWPKTQNDMMDAQQTLLKNDLELLVARALTGALHELHITS